MGISYRCSNPGCRKRFQLRKPANQYIRPPKCPECGGTSIHATKYDYLNTKRKTCFCSGIGWPHRIGLILDPHRTCHQADINKIEELDFNESLNVHTSQKMGENDDCPF